MSFRSAALTKCVAKLHPINAETNRVMGNPRLNIYQHSVTTPVPVLPFLHILMFGRR